MSNVTGKIIKNKQPSNKTFTFYVFDMRKLYVVRNLMQTNWHRLSFLVPLKLYARKTSVRLWKAYMYISANRSLCNWEVLERNGFRRERIKPTRPFICKHTKDVVICLIFNTRMQWHICHGEKRIFIVPFYDCRNACSCWRLELLASSSFKFLLRHSIALSTTTECAFNGAPTAFSSALKVIDDYKRNSSYAFVLYCANAIEQFLLNFLIRIRLVKFEMFVTKAAFGTCAVQLNSEHILTIN